MVIGILLPPWAVMMVGAAPPSVVDYIALMLAGAFIDVA